MKNSKGIWFFLILMCAQNEFAFGGGGERKQGLASDCASMGRIPCCNSKWILAFLGDGSGWCSNPKQQRAKIVWSCRPYGPIGAVVGSTTGSIIMGPEAEEYPVRDSEGQECKIIATLWIDPNNEL